MRIVILTPAKEEILESSLFYLEQSPQAAIKFEDELDAAWSSLRSNPERIGSTPMTLGFWSSIAFRFPFCIVSWVMKCMFSLSLIMHDGQDFGPEGDWCSQPSLHKT